MLDLTLCEHTQRRSKEGDTFIVYNKEELAEKVFPHFFTHTKFTSLSRQLNFYGWKKVPQADSKSKHVEFYHKYFQRDRTELLHLIHRPTRNNDERRISKSNNNEGDKANDSRHQADEIKMLKRKVSHLEAQTTRMQIELNKFHTQMTRQLQMLNAERGLKDSSTFKYPVAPDPSVSKAMQFDHQPMAGIEFESTFPESSTSSIVSTPRSEHGTKNDKMTEVRTLEGFLTPPSVNTKEAASSNVTTVPLPPDERLLRPSELLRGFSKGFGSSLSSIDAEKLTHLMTDNNSNTKNTTSNTPSHIVTPTESANISTIPVGKELDLPVPPGDIDFLESTQNI